MKNKNIETIRYFSRNILIVVGLVLMWRGVWYVLDYLDSIIFGGSHIITSLGGIIVGLLILYLPDKDLKEIQKL